MKTIKKTTACILAAALVLSTFAGKPTNVEANSSAEQLKATEIFTPIQVGASDSYSHSTQLLLGDYLYEATGDTLNRYRKDTGEQAGSVKLADSITASFANWTDNYASLTAGNDMIFVPILSGRIQAIDTKTMKSLWITESKDGFYNDSACVYENGYLYGALNGDKKGLVFCLDTTDENPENTSEIKDFSWTANDTKGHYWATPFLTKDCILIADEAEDGTISAYEKNNGKSKGTLAVTGPTRSGIGYDADRDLYYTVNKSGVITAFSFTKESGFTKKNALTITVENDSEAKLNCISTPLIENNHVFILSGYGTKTLLTKVNADSLAIENQYLLEDGAPTCPNLALYQNDNYNLLLFTLNNKEGGIYGINLLDTNPAFIKIYGPEIVGFGNYCMDSVTVDNNNLYYTNDSCRLYGLQINIQGSTPSPSPTTPTLVPTVTPSATPSSQPVQEVISTPTKVKNLKASVKKKVVTLRWKKVNGTTKYQIYAKKGNKKYKKVSTTKNTKIKKKFAKGIYRIKVRAIKQSNNVTKYGSFSKSIKIKL